MYQTQKGAAIAYSEL